MKIRELKRQVDASRENHKENERCLRATVSRYDRILVNQERRIKSLEHAVANLVDMILRGQDES